MGGEEVRRRLSDSEPRDNLQQFVSVRGETVRLEQQGYTAMALVFARLARGEPPEFANRSRDTMLQACAQAEVPVPPIGLGVAEGVAMDRVGSDEIRME